MKKATLVVLIVVLCSAFGLCRQIKFRSPSDLVAALQQENNKYHAEVVQEMHKYGPDGYGLERCKFQDHEVGLEDGYQNLVLSANCPNSIYLIVLRRKGKQKWTWIDAHKFESFYDRPSFEFMNAVSPAYKSIVVHNHSSVVGAGMFQTSMLILHLIDGRLQAVLGALEKREGPVIESTPRETESEFSITPPAPRSPGRVEQNEASYTGDKMIRTKRIFVWNEDIKRFLVQKSEAELVEGPSGSNSDDVRVLMQELPAYPILSRHARIQGDVKIAVTFDSKGQAMSLEKVSGHPMLYPSASDAVKTWRILSRRNDLSGRHEFTLHYKLCDTTRISTDLYPTVIRVKSPSEIDVISDLAYFEVESLTSGNF